MGLFSGLFGGDDQQVIQQNQDPWGPQQPFLTQGFQRADALFGGAAPQFFPYSTVTPFAREQEQGLTGIANQARAGSPNLRAAQGLYGNTLGGAFLNNNPTLGATFDRAFGRLKPQIQSMFAGAGGMGPSGAEATALAQGGADLAAQIYGQDYGRERALQQQAMFGAPAFAQARFQDPTTLMGVGQARRGLGQEQLADQRQRFDFYQNRPRSQLADYMGFITGNYGGQQTTQQPLYSNPLASVLGGAASGAGLSMFLGPKGAGLT